MKGKEKEAINEEIDKRYWKELVFQR